MFRSSWQKKTSKACLFGKPSAMQDELYCTKVCRKVFNDSICLRKLEMHLAETEQLHEIAYWKHFEFHTIYGSFLKTPHKIFGSVRLFMFCIPDISVPQIVKYQALMSTKKSEILEVFKKLFMGYLLQFFNVNNTRQGLINKDANLPNLLGEFLRLVENGEKFCDKQTLDSLGSLTHFFTCVSNLIRRFFCRL